MLFGVGLLEAQIESLVKEGTPDLVEALEMSAEGVGNQTAAFSPSLRVRLESQGLSSDDVYWSDGQEFESYAYPIHRRVRNYVIEELSKEFEMGALTNTIGDVTSVETDFRNLHFYGVSRELARKVNAVFGNKGFKVLLSMSIDDESALKTLQVLKEMRERRLSTVV